MAETLTEREAPLLENLIGGRRVTAVADAAVDVLDPASGDVLARTPLSGAADVDRAARAGSDAFPAWADTPVTERARVMFRL